jgi:hypothetical protein
MVVRNNVNRKRGEVSGRERELKCISTKKIIYIINEIGTLIAVESGL